MTVATIQLRVALPRVIVILVAAILQTRRASIYSHAQVRPDDAASTLRAGDKVEITRRNQSIVHFKIKKIDDTKVSGSDSMSMFGRAVSIPTSDVTNIKLYKKEAGYNADATIEAYAWIWGFVFWPLVL